MMSRKPRQSQPLIPYEDTEQIALAPWLDMKFGEKGWEHVPGQRWAKVQYLVKLKRMGAKKGTLDIRIYKQIVERERFELRGYETTSTTATVWLPVRVYSGLVVEMKRREGGKLEPEQKLWIEAMIENGWKVIVANGAQDAINKIEEVYGR